MQKTLILSIGGIMAVSAVTAATLETTDSNADGMVSFDELLVIAPDVSEETFRLADVNEDGMIDAEEFAIAQETGLLPTG